MVQRFSDRLLIMQPPNRFAVFRWLFTCALLAISGTGFASEDPEAASLRSHAAHQLELAVSAVDEAARKKALWIPAVKALDEARAAFASGDFEQAVKLARAARQFAALGMRQLEAPPYRHF